MDGSLNVFSETRDVQDGGEPPTISLLMVSIFNVAGSYPHIYPYMQYNPLTFLYIYISKYIYIYPNIYIYYNNITHLHVFIIAVFLFGGLVLFLWRSRSYSAPKLTGGQLREARCQLRLPSFNHSKLIRT